MARRQLTAEWSIDVDEDFRQRVVDGNLQMVSPGPPVRTIWIAVWGSGEESIDELRAGIGADASAGARRFEEGEADEWRYASWYPEPTEDGGVQWGLYAYTVRAGSYVQAAFLTDHEEDLGWALAAWRSLRATPADG